MIRRARRASKDTDHDISAAAQTRVRALRSFSTGGVEGRGFRRV